MSLFLKKNYESKTVDDLTIAVVPIEKWLKKINMNFEDKIKTNYKEVNENFDVSSKNLKLELKK